MHPIRSFRAEERENLQKDFPILAANSDRGRLCYLDNAATSLTPLIVVDEMARYYHEVRANIHRGKHLLSELASAEYEEGRHAVAQFVGCRGDELVFVRNTTEAINLVCLGLGLEKEDVVLISGDAHHSNFLPWHVRATTKVIRVDAKGRVDLQHYRSLLGSSPRVVAINHCSNVTGIYAPLHEMATMAKEAGALVVVDASQSIAHQRIHLERTPIDFLAFSGHKMCGPTGIGVLCGRSGKLASLSPTYYGGGMVDWVTWDSFVLRKIPHVFEAGTPNIAGVYGLAAAVKYLSQYGEDRLASHDREMAGILYGEVLKREYIEPIAGTDAHSRAGILSFGFVNHANMDHVAQILSDAYRVMCRSGYLCAQPFVSESAGRAVLRVSAYFYNDLDDVEALFAALDEIYLSYSR
jgi:cysteine desulfurase/selenocysteine lyase